MCQTTRDVCHGPGLGCRGGEPGNVGCGVPLSIPYVKCIDCFPVTVEGLLSKLEPGSDMVRMCAQREITLNFLVHTL